MSFLRCMVVVVSVRVESEQRRTVSLRVGLVTAELSQPERIGIF